LTVAASIGSSNVAVGLTVRATSAAPSAGVTADTSGGRVSAGCPPLKTASTQ
jgi:hypothetical protein